MARIDASQGRDIPSLRVSRPAIGGEFDGAGSVGAGLRALGQGLSAIGAERRAEAEAEQRSADTVTMAKAVTAFETEAVASLDAAASDYDGAEPGFADAYAASVKSRFDRVIESLPARMRSEAQVKLLHVGKRLDRSAEQIERRRRNAYTLGGIGETADQLVTNVSRDASMVTSAREAIDDLVQAAPVQLQQDLRGELNREVGLAAASYYEANSPAEGAALAAQGYFDGLLDAKDTIRVEASLRAAEERRQRELERRAEQRRREDQSRLAAEARAISAAYDAGVPVPEARLERFRDAAMAVGGETAERVAAQEQTARVVAELTDMPLPQAMATAASLRADVEAQAEPPEQSLQFLQQVERTVAAMRQRIAADPIGYERDRGGSVPELDMDDLGASLPQRAVLAEALAERHGQAPRFFADGEAETLGLEIAASPERGMAAIETIIDTAPDMLTELDDTVPEIAHVAGVLAAGGERGFAADALEALKRREAGALPQVPTSQILFQSAEAEARQALAYAPGLLNRSRDLAKLTTASAMQKLGQGTNDAEAQRYRAHLQRAVGHSRRGGQDFGGFVSMGRGPLRRAVLVPPSVAQKEFRRAWANGSDAQWAAALQGRPVDSQGREVSIDVLRRATPVATGPKQYRAMIGPDRFVVDAETGRALIVDVSKLTAGVP